MTIPPWRAGDLPVETRVHLRRTGSVDIFAVSPPRGGARGISNNNEDSTLFEATLDTPDRRHLRVSTDAPLRDSTAFNEFGRTSGGASSLPKPNSSVTTSSKAVLSALRSLQVSVRVRFGVHRQRGVACAADIGGRMNVVLEPMTSQDKIKRLEQERNSATDEVVRLKRHVAELERQVEGAARRPSDVSVDKHHAARLAYERLLADKSAVDARLSKTGASRGVLEQPMTFGGQEWVDIGCTGLGRPRPSDS